MNKEFRPKDKLIAISLSSVFNRSIRFHLGIFSLLMVSLGVQSCASRKTGERGNQADTWRIVKVDKSQQADWVISSRKVGGSNFLEYKIEGPVEAPPQDCRDAFRAAIYEEANKEENKKYPTYELVENLTHSILTYVVHKEPFPLKNTEMSVRYLFFEHEDGSLGVKWKEAWEESAVKPSRKLSRVQSFRGSWNFSPTKEGASHAVNVVQFDLKKMPLWLAEPMVLKFLKNGLKDIRTKVK